MLAMNAPPDLLVTSGTVTLKRHNALDDVVVLVRAVDYQSQGHTAGDRALRKTERPAVGGIIVRALNRGVRRDNGDAAHVAASGQGSRSGERVIAIDRRRRGETDADLIGGPDLAAQLIVFLIRRFL